MNRELKKLWNNAVEIAVFVLFLWAVFFLDQLIPYNLNQWGIIPRTNRGLIGIVTSPFLHGSMKHLASNSVPIFVLLLTAVTFYKRKATTAVIGIILIGGGLVWAFGRSASHIGISGLIYGLVTFLIMAGILKKKFVSILISILIAVVYGGIIWRIFPGQYWISWEGHLFGAIAGVIMAFAIFKRRLF